MRRVEPGDSHPDRGKVHRRVNGTPGVYTGSVGYERDKLPIHWQWVSFALTIGYVLLKTTCDIVSATNTGTETVHRLVRIHRIKRDMSRDFKRAEIELVADPSVRDRFKLAIRNPEIHLDAANGCIHVYLDSGDLSNLAHDITVARLEDDQICGKLDMAQ